MLLLFQVTRTKVKVAVLMAESNIPLAFRKLFPDSKIPQKYSAAATKTTCEWSNSTTFLEADGKYHYV